MAGDRDEIAAPMNWMAEREAVVAEAEELTRARTRLWSYSLIGPGIWRVGSVDLIERLDGTAGPSGGDQECRREASRRPTTNPITMPTGNPKGPQALPISTAPTIPPKMPASYISRRASPRAGLRCFTRRGLPMAEGGNRAQ